MYNTVAAKTKMLFISDMTKHSINNKVIKIYTRITLWNSRVLSEMKQFLLHEICSSFGREGGLVLTNTSRSQVQRLEESHLFICVHVCVCVII